MGLGLLTKARLHPIESETDETALPTELTAQPQTRSPSGRRYTTPADVTSTWWIASRPSWRCSNGVRLSRHVSRRANFAGVARYCFLKARMKWLLSVKCQSAAASETLSREPEAVSASAASSRRRRRM